MAVYFLSDLHLGPSSLPSLHEAERRVCRFLDSVKGDATQIFLVGDILDYWYEYRYAVPRGYVRFLGKLAELSDQGIKITWLIGNHDIWIFDYLPTELGIRVVDGAVDETVDGQRIYVTHGDGIGRRSPYFRAMRSIFRNRFCQWLYSGIHPRWTIPFAYRWSRHSRMGHDCDPARDEKVKRHQESLRDFCLQYLKQHPDVRHFIFGHLHTLSLTRLTPEADMAVIGDWLANFSYARLDGGILSLHRCECEP